MEYNFLLIFFGIVYLVQLLIWLFKVKFNSKQSFIVILFIGGQLLFGGNFTDIANVVGQPIALPENPFEDKYDQLVAQLKSNIHHLYEQLFSIQKEAVQALQNGKFDFEGCIRAFYDKIEAIKKQIDEWAAVAKFELEVFALTILGDWIDVINQYKQNIASTVQSIETMLQQLTENLLKNIIDVIVKIVPNADAMIENLKSQGLLSFY